MKYLKLNKKGFTLIEILLVLTVSSTLILALGSFMILSFEIFQFGENYIKVQQDFRIISEYLTEELQNAKEIKIIDSVPLNPDGYNYIFIESNSLKIKKSTGNKILYSKNITSLTLNLSS